MSNNNLSETVGTPTLLNVSGLDINFIVSGLSGVEPKFLFYDASTGRLGLNTNLPDSALHIVAPCANDGLKIEGTTNCATGVRLLLQHNPGTSPETGSYPATIDFSGRDTNGSLINYAQITSKILNPVTSNTSGELIFRTDYSGSLSEVFKASVANLVLGGLNNISGYSYNVVGSDNVLSGLLYVNLGSNNEGTIYSGLLLGNNLLVDINNGVIVSNNAQIDGDRVVVFGNTVGLTGNNSIVIANNSYLNSNNSILVGNDVRVANNSHNNLLLLNNANLSGSYGLGFGSSVNNTGNNNLFIGNNTSVVGNNNSIIGSDIATTGDNNLAYGNFAKISGTSVVSIGLANNIISIQSGLFIGNDISLVDAEKIVVMGFNNNLSNSLDNSVVIGIDNATTTNEADNLIVVGQKNISSNIKNSVILGNKNNLSGVVNTNVVLGPDNYTALTSNNNVLIGGLNNNSGLSINTQGAISGTAARASNLLNNTNIIGINNLAFSTINSSIFGNKNYVSGNNVNIFGSFNNIKNASNIQNLGNSNFIHGNNNHVMGSKVTLIGQNSIINNPSTKEAYAFGSGSILFGDNQFVLNGMCMGDNNSLKGQDNIVHGLNNTVGLAYHKSVIAGNTIEILGNVSAFYRDGEQILIAVYHPVSTGNLFIRTIGGAADNSVFFNMVNNTTTIFITEPISLNGLLYGRKDNFDDPLVENTTSTILGIVFPYSITETDDDGITRTKNYGKNNIVIGRNNKYLHHSGLVLGNSNNITGINNVVIGNNISGNYNNSLQIGTNNTNKIYLDDINVIFNSGALQENIIFRSRDTINNPISMRLNLGSNRLGINNNNPRSTLDVSGILTTQSLRVGLSTLAGYSLISDSSGNATWQFPVNLSGLNSGLLYKVNDKVASGSDVLQFNNINKHLTYIYTTSPNLLNLDPQTYPGIIFTPSGLYINETVDDDTIYNMKINGSGIGGIVNEENATIFGDATARKVLFETLPQFNMIKVFNISGASGHLWRHTVTDRLFVPLSLTGTFLRVSSTNGLLNSFTTNPNSILFSNNLSQQTGNNLLKFYSVDNVMTIGATGLSLPQETVFPGVTNDILSNIILSSSSGHGTVFNAAGRSDKLVSIYNSGAASSRLGLHYATGSGVLGLGVSDSQTFPSTNAGNTSTWSTHNVKLFVNGVARVHGLQFLKDGQFDSSVTNTYLKVDSNGMVSRAPLDFNTSFSGTWPIFTQSNAGLTTIGLSVNRSSDTTSPMGASDNGSMLVWNGIRWINNSRGLKVIQPSLTNTNSNNIYGPIMGADSAASLNSSKNSSVIAGGPFVQEAGIISQEYIGSNQDSKHFLKGRTIQTSSVELISNFDKKLSSTVTFDNTISIEALYRPDNDGTPVYRSGQLGVWNYTINYCGLIGPYVSNEEVDPTDLNRNWNAVAGKLEGSVLFYNKPGQGYLAINLGQESHTFRASSTYVSSWDSNNPPITVSFITGVSPKRMQITARGIANTNILWNCSVDIHQLNHPVNIRAGADI